MFQRVVQSVLGDLLEAKDGAGVLVYIDDVLVFSPTFESHVATLEKVFERLQKANLYPKWKKCQFFTNEGVKA